MDAIGWLETDAEHWMASREEHRKGPAAAVLPARFHSRRLLRSATLAMPPHSSDAFDEFEADAENGAQHQQYADKISGDEE
jgi:hypothetical protein